MRNLFSALALTLVLSSVTVAQQSENQKPVYDSTAVYKPMDPWNSSDWVLTVTPYAWAPDIDGKATLNGRTGTVDTTFNHIWNHLDFAAMGRVEAWKGNWSIFVDAIYAKASANFDLSLPPFGATLAMKFKLGMADFGGSYKLIDTPVGNSAQRIIFTPYAGGRYAYLQEKVDISPTGPFAPIIGQRTIGGTEDWVEPFVGGRVIWKITDRFFAAFRGDAGGFGIGDASQLTWNLLGWFGYQINKNVAIEAGYRILDIDYSNGSGRNELGMNAQLRGPVAGITIRF